MSKLALDVETLVVESFETVRQSSARGTVAAQAWRPTDNCTSEYEATCGTECETGGTCGTLCWGSDACERTQYPLCTQ